MLRCIIQFGLDSARGHAKLPGLVNREVDLDSSPAHLPLVTDPLSPV